MQNLTDTPAQREPTRRVRAWYVMGLGTIAALSVIGQVLMHGLIVSEADRSRIINIAGRQRMLSQRIAKEALAGNDESLKADLSTWSSVHNSLITGSEALGLPLHARARDS